MKTNLVRIGNSRGVRIPKPLIEQCGLGERVEVRVEDECLIISPERKPREGWEDLFRAAGSAANDERWLESAAANEFDHKEWKW
jgi:antitoxin MazE